MPKTKTYTKLQRPRTPRPDGLFAMKDKAGKRLGLKCLICGKELHYRKGRPQIICKKQDCFRATRNAYRRDYEAARA